MQFEDFDEYQAAAEGLGMEFVQLDKGPFLGRLQQTFPRNVCISHFNFNRHFHQRGIVGGYGRSFGLLFGADSSMSWLNQPFGSTSLAVFPPDGSFEAVSYPGFDAVSISIHTEFLEEAAELFAFPDALDAMPSFGAVYDLDRTTGRRLRTAVHGYLADDARPCNEVGLRELEFEIARLILSAFVDRDYEVKPAKSRMRDRALTRALDLIDASGGEQVYIPELCRSVGASERTLRYAFQDRFGVSPKQYINAHRFRQVRQALSSAEPDGLVQDIISLYGFWHTGQFAADYRKTFGEYPSETLLRPQQ